MSTTTPTMVKRVLVASTSNAAGGTTRGTLDLRGKCGGFLTLRMSNGGTAPTLQCLANVLISHAEGATPGAGSDGADWYRIAQFGGTITASRVTPVGIDIPPCQHLEVEFTGNTGQAVTVVAEFTEYSNYSTT